MFCLSYLTERFLAFYPSHMTKRKALIKQISAEAKKQGMPFVKANRKGGRHEIWSLNGTTIPIPRHTELTEQTTNAIRKECSEELGKDWWK